MASVAAAASTAAAGSTPARAARMLLGRLRRCGGAAAGLQARGSKAPLKWMEKRESLDGLAGRERFDLSLLRRQQGVPRITDEIGFGDPALRSVTHEVRELAAARRWEEALHVFSTVPEPDLHLRVSVLGGLSRAFEAEKAWRWFEAMPSKPLVSYNFMIAMCSRMNMLSQVERLWKELHSNGLRPNAVTYTVVVTAYGSVGDVDSALRILDEMEASGHVLTEVEYGVGIAACGKAGDYAKGRALLAKMESAGQMPHVGHMTSLITCCARRKDEAQAREVFADIRRRGLRPDVVAYTAFASCLSGPEALQKVQALREEMLAEGILPHTFFYNEMLRAALESQQLGAFEQLLREMDERGIPRNTGTERKMLDRDRMALNATPSHGSSAGEQDTTRWPHAAAPAAASPSTATPPPLPYGWQETKDPASGLPYYWREADPANSVTWQRPA